MFISFMKLFIVKGYYYYTIELLFLFTHPVEKQWLYLPYSLVKYGLCSVFFKTISNFIRPLKECHNTDTIDWENKDLKKLFESFGFFFSLHFLQICSYFI